MKGAICNDMATAANYREQYAQYKRYFTSLAEQYQKKPVVRVSVEFLLTLLTISFFAVFAIRPTVLTIAQLISDVRSQQQIKRQLDEKIANIQKAQALASREASRLTFLDQALPAGPQPDFLVRQIEGLAGSHNVFIESLSIGKLPLYETKSTTSPQGKFASFEVSFLIRGSYSATHAFLNEIENLRRIVNLTSISYGPSTKEGESGVIILAVGAQVPYFPEKKE